MKLGALDISTVKLGTNQVQAVYQGVDLVWQNAPVATAATGVGSNFIYCKLERLYGCGCLLIRCK
jgi:hypothetical protein